MASVDHVLSSDGIHFVTEYHLASLSTFAKDGTIHVVPVGFTYERGVVRIITSGTSQKVLNIQRDARATVSQVDRGRWLTFIGTARILDDADTVKDAVTRYAARYRQPRVNPLRVAIVLDVQRTMGSAGMLST